MNRTQLEDLWTRLLAGELSPDEEQLLEAELEQNKLQRHLLLRDGEMDRQLDSLPHSQQTGEAFTAQVVDSWQREQKTAFIAPSTNNFASQLEDLATLDEEELPDTPWPIAETHHHEGRRSWLKSTLVAVVLIACAILLLINSEWMADPRMQASRQEDESAVRPRDRNAARPAPKDNLDPMKQQVAPANRDLPGNAKQAKPAPGDPAPVKEADQPAVPKAPPGRVADGNGKPPAKTVARLTQVEACRWKGDPPAEWLGTDVLHLLSGKATIAFNEGAVVELEGPTLFELNSTKEGVLRMGKLKASVPPQSKDFRLQTPVGTVMDKGPEFTVQTEDDGSTTVAALQGTVAMQESGPDGKPGKVTALQEGESQRFAMKIVRGGPQLGLKPVPGRFQGKVAINGRVFEFNNEEEFKKFQKQWMEQMRRLPLNPRLPRGDQVNPFMPNGFPPFPLDFAFPPNQLPGMLGRPNGNPGRKGRERMEGQGEEQKDRIELDNMDLREFRKRMIERANQRQK